MSDQTLTIRFTKKNIAIIGVVVVVIISSLLIFTLRNSITSPNNPDSDPNQTNTVTNQSNNPSDLSFKQFSSCKDFSSRVDDYFNQSNNQNNPSYMMEDRAMSTSVAPNASVSNKMMAPSTGSNLNTPNTPSTDFSGTNNQVLNVDEGDIIKTNGKNVFTVNGRNVNITSVDPENGNISKIAKISLSQTFSNVNELNLYQNYLLVSGSGYSDQRSQSVIAIYDINDPSNPNLIRELALDGNLKTSRMVDGTVYLVNNYTSNELYSYPRPIPMRSTNIFSILFGNEPYTSQNQATPPLSESEKIAKVENSLPKVYDSLYPAPKRSNILYPCEQIKYVYPIQSLNFMTVLALDLNNPKGEIGKEVVMGNSENVFASEKNLYLAQTNYNYNYSSKNQQTTSIFKFNLKGTRVQFQTSGKIPGTVLNQFSMDEYDDNLRVATNENNYSKNTQTNNIFILDDQLKLIGSLEDLAKGERIYSVRFIGKKGYMVTFKKVDPLFTFDLSDPKNPKVLGELKIPGYSDYLHPISDNLIIGIGKNTIEATDSFGDSQGFAWYQGVKLGLFDVSDMTKPKEIGKVEIGDRGTDSPVLTDHKALLWDKRNNLLTIPITLMLIPDEQKSESSKKMINQSPAYGQFKYQGSYVYEVSPSNGFKLKGRISHLENKAKTDLPIITDKKYDEFGQVIEDSKQTQATNPNIAISEPYYNSDDFMYYINRQLYINNFLITFSPKQLQSNKITDLSLVNNVLF